MTVIYREALEDIVAYLDGKPIRLVKPPKSGSAEEGPA
jgi:hypothetical protein